MGAKTRSAKQYGLFFCKEQSSDEKSFGLFRCIKIETPIFNTKIQSRYAEHEEHKEDKFKFLYFHCVLCAALRPLCLKGFSLYLCG